MPFLLGPIETKPVLILFLTKSNNSFSEDIKKIFSYSRCLVNKNTANFCCASSVAIFMSR